VAAKCNRGAAVGRVARLHQVRPMGLQSLQNGVAALTAQGTSDRPLEPVTLQSTSQQALLVPSCESDA
jgi:hypothetical protein